MKDTTEYTFECFIEFHPSGEYETITVQAFDVESALSQANDIARQLMSEEDEDFSITVEEDFF